MAVHNNPIELKSTAGQTATISPEGLLEIDNKAQQIPEEHRRLMLIYRSEILQLLDALYAESDRIAQKSLFPLVVGALTGHAEESSQKVAEEAKNLAKSPGTCAKVLSIKQAENQMAEAIGRVRFFVCEAV